LYLWTWHITNCCSFFRNKAIISYGYWWSTLNMHLSSPLVQQTKIWFFQKLSSQEHKCVTIMLPLIQSSCPQLNLLSCGHTSCLLPCIVIGPQCLHWGLIFHLTIMKWKIMMMNPSFVETSTETTKKAPTWNRIS